MKKLYERAIDETGSYVEFAGLSTESVPAGKYVTGRLLHEVDTATIKAYNATSGEWVTQIVLGGASDE